VRHANPQNDKSVTNTNTMSWHGWHGEELTAVEVMPDPFMTSSAEGACTSVGPETIELRVISCYNAMDGKSIVTQTH